MLYYMCRRIVFVKNTGSAKIYCLTVSGRNFGTVQVSVNECTPLLADSTEFVMVGTAWLESHVPLKVFRVLGLQAVSPAQQHIFARDHSDFVSSCFQTRLKKIFHLCGTTTEQHNGYRRQIKACCLKHFYHIRPRIWCIWVGRMT